ncbi:hypothetical protein [Rhodopirellula baltica]|nr:hypothetical protein [Rhodopirellula baltica]EGF27339.1 hypothetical protein RBWH47_00398 [Rhodopirellula baltica WH47]EKK00415.1 hypothetical protein RBSH_04142 [Rhodopirellula baltica SH28]ELP34316.1 hypothetical protein RBSWK_01695 [Rhodopirellula baltica SWK14]HBE63204.1 hypothetical protein [Rhodopirellula baltica]
MNSSLRLGLIAILAVVASGLVSPSPAAAQTSPFLRMFKRGNKVEVDTTKTYELTQEDGPWLILAHTFVGAGSKERAERLALEIRQELNLPSYVYEENFDFSGEVETPTSTIQVAGGATRPNHRRMRYANSIQYDAHAVLVGEYDHAEHPQIAEDLKRIKSAKLPVFGDKKEMEAETDFRNPVTAVKALHRQFVSRSGDKDRGEMGSAFLTRNPMLPDDFSHAPEVDSFVRKLNEDKQFNLLECDGKFTVVVRTFEGYKTIVDGKKEKNFQPNINRLDRMAMDANKMVVALRKEGQEAYQYHDRTRSIVTIGSFETLGYDLPDGGFEYAPEIQAIMSNYRAFNVDPSIANQVKSKTNDGLAAKHIENIPFDVQPTPIRIPKASKRSFYSAAVGR